MKERLKDLEIQLDLTNEALFMAKVLFITKEDTENTSPWNKIVPKNTLTSILERDNPKELIQNRMNMFMQNILHRDIIKVALNDSNNVTCSLDDLYLTEGCIMLHSSTYVKLDNKCHLIYDDNRDVIYTYLDQCRVIVDDRVPKNKGIVFTEESIALEPLEIDVDITDNELTLQSAFKFTIFDNVVVTLR